MKKTTGLSVAAVFLSLILTASCQGQAKYPSLSRGNRTPVIIILARGGYSPSETTAKAGVPSVLRLVTKYTYDCSRVLVLPSLRVQKILPATGTADFALPAQKPGTKFYGICGMGMYSFTITFK
jgi:plastocyanin domain-containing protein